MTDLALRTLERAAAVGDDEARGRFLALRVKLGQLRKDRLKLAASMGDLVAKRVLGWEPIEWRLGGDLKGRRRERRRWKVLMRRHGKVAAIVGAEAALRAAFDPERAPWLSKLRSFEVLERVRLWSECPCREHRLAVKRDMLYGWVSWNRKAVIHLRRSLLSPDQSFVWESHAAIQTVLAARYEPAAEWPVVVENAVKQALIAWALQQEPTPAPSRIVE